MYAASGVGLAGPQIGISKRIFTVDASPFAEPEEGEELDEKLKELKDFKKVFVNPIIENETGSPWPFSEGCLSIPGIREDVERKAVIKISYYDENWNFFEESYQGIAARIIQHEYDHIEGILFTDHLNPLKKRLMKRKLEEISKGKVEVNYKMKFYKK
jgi:peptide deformylase